METGTQKKKPVLLIVMAVALGISLLGAALGGGSDDAETVAASDSKPPVEWSATEPDPYGTFTIRMDNRGSRRIDVTTSVGFWLVDHVPYDTDMVTGQLMCQNVDGSYSPDRMLRFERGESLGAPYFDAATVREFAGC